MATMYHLFFGVLLIVICRSVGAIHYPLGRQCVASLAETPRSDLRQKIIDIAQREIGVQEATGNNDGKRVEEYLRYTGLGKGYAWCAAFASWCYGQAGLPEPRNPWSPALFPNARSYCRGEACGRSETMKAINAADVFGIYGQHAGRINHVGLITRLQGSYLITIEGNSNNRVESRRRHLSTIYAIADWSGGRL